MPSNRNERKPGMKKKILAIDDETDFLKMLKINLEEGGTYEVLTLSNAKDIIEQVHFFMPDVILLDIIMPGVQGVDACEMLSKDFQASRIPVIIISALNKVVDKFQAYKVGAVDYLTKPVEKEKLIHSIEKAIGLKQQI